MIAETARRTARAGCLLAGLLALHATEAVAGKNPPDSFEVFRVIRLHETDLYEATMRLRTEVGIAAFATIGDGGTIVIRDLPDRIELAETVLRGLDSSLRSVEPHPPLQRLRPEDAARIERSFACREGGEKSALTAVRALYGTRETRTADPATLIVRDTEPILEAMAALFAELGLLADESEAAP